MPYDYFDDNNRDIPSGYPEHIAVYNGDKKELTYFYRGEIAETLHADKHHQAEQMYDNYISDLEENGLI